MRVAFHLPAAAEIEPDLLDASACQQQHGGGSERGGWWPQQQRYGTLSEGEK